jgi:hypothetical protein
MKIGLQRCFLDSSAHCNVLVFCLLAFNLNLASQLYSKLTSIGLPYNLCWTSIHHQALLVKKNINYQNTNGEEIKINYFWTRWMGNNCKQFVQHIWIYKLCRINSSLKQNNWRKKVVCWFCFVTFGSPKPKGPGLCCWHHSKP